MCTPRIWCNQDPEEEALITLQDVEQAMGVPAAQWHGRCFEVATAAAKLIPGSRAVYGHWLGDVAPEGFWGRIQNGPFIPHGWVRLKEGGVLDPTRFSFENKEPYLWEGSNGTEYDEGGNRWRTETMGPPPDFEPGDVFTANERILPSAAWTFIEGLLNLDSCWDEDYEPGDISKMQLLWLANYDPNLMEGHAPAIYKMLDHFGLKAAVPIDNWLKVLG